MKCAAIEREEYVSRVLNLYLGLAETPARWSRPDQTGDWPKNSTKSGSSLKK